jgi:hypothetical protein
MSDYDYSHQTRSQPHGFEYRSLPSFIASKEFTKIVLELAMGIGRLVLESVKDKKDINYERPVTEAGYMLFTTQEVFKKFMRYINGDKRDLFLKNVIKEWGINPDRYNKITIENLNVISARPFRHEFEEPLHDISLQINEALSDDGIILNKPIVIYILIIPEESTRVVGDIFSTSHFLLPPTLNKMSLIGSYTQPTQSDEKSIALEALEATVNGQQELVISIFKKNVRDTSLLHNIIVANLAIFARSSLCNGKHIYDILTKRWLLDEEFISFFRMKNLAIPLASEISFDPWFFVNTASTMPINGVAF